MAQGESHGPLRCVRGLGVHARQRPVIGRAVGALRAAGLHADRGHGGAKRSPGTVEGAILKSQELAMVLHWALGAVEASLLGSIARVEVFQEARAEKDPARWSERLSEGVHGGGLEEARASQECGVSELSPSLQSSSAVGDQTPGGGAGGTAFESGLLGGFRGGQQHRQSTL